MATVDPALVFSERQSAWQTIAQLRLRLGKAVHFYQHHYRGTAWLIIADQERETYFRCSSNVEQFLHLLDGRRSVEQALLDTRHLQDSVLQHQDVIVLVANLKSSGLLEEDVEQLGDTTWPATKPKVNRWRNPFAIKFALVNPDGMLHKTAHWFKPLFSPVFVILWVGLVLVALAAAALNWQELLEHSEARFADPKNLIWYWLLYPLIKCLHEFGHAYATRYWGGEVREMGITLLVFFPVPYVDSSAAHRFSSKHKRLAVCAAGILVEVFLAAVALLVWTNTDQGLMRDLAFDIVIIGGISTLLFNANPLLRFDGYYIVSELLEIPNLGTRADQYLGYLFKRFVLDMPELRTPITAHGEAKWLVMYGILARVYRVFISLVIAFWVAGKFMIVGGLLALWAIVAHIVYPLALSVYRLIPQVVKASRMKRFSAVVTVTLILCLLGLVTPTSYSTYTEGVVSLPDDAFIRSGIDGLVTRVLLTDGEPVEKGEVILTLEDIELEARLHSLFAQLEEARAMQQAAFLKDRSQATYLKSKVSAIDADIRVVEDQLASLDVVSATTGVVSLPTASDLLGRYVSRGDVMGYVAGQSQLSALVVIPQLAIDTVRRELSSIEVRLSSRPGETLKAAFIQEIPQATDRLPNRILGSASGGLIAVDARDTSGMQLLTNVFLVEIALPMETSGNYLGQRIFVRFIHQDESVGNRLMRKVSHLLMQPPFT